MHLPIQKLRTEVEPGIEVSTVEEHTGFFDTCIFSNVALPDIDLRKSYRNGTWQGARIEHREQVERVREALRHV